VDDEDGMKKKTLKDQIKTQFKKTLYKYKPGIYLFNFKGKMTDKLAFSLALP